MLFTNHNCPCLVYPAVHKPLQIAGYHPTLLARMAFSFAVTTSSLANVVKPIWNLHWGWFGYGSIPIHTIFRGMNIHLPAILMFTRGTGFWPIPIYCWVYQIKPMTQEVLTFEIVLPKRWTTQMQIQEKSTDKWKSSLPSQRDLVTITSWYQYPNAFLPIAAEKKHQNILAALVSHFRRSTFRICSDPVW